MKLTINLLSIFLVTIISSSAFGKDGILIMEPQSNTIEPNDLEAIYDFLVIEIDSLGLYEVVAYDDIKAQLDLDRQQQLLGCNAIECAVELGGALGKHYLLTEKISVLDGDVIITLALINIIKQKITRAQIKGNNKKNLYSQFINIAVNDLFSKVTLTSKPSKPLRKIKSISIGEKPSDWLSDLKEPVLVKFDALPISAVITNADGKLLCANTPCQKVLNSGRYDIKVQAESYETVQLNVTVYKGMGDVNVTLIPTFGLLDVTSIPSNLNVKVDGIVVGVTPLHNHKVNPSGHEILITDPKYYDKGWNVVIKKGEHQKLNATLNSKKGRLIVTAKDHMGVDISANVFVDEVEVGSTPSATNLIIGDHEVTVKHDDNHSIFEQQVNLDHEQVTTVDAQLVKKLIRPRLVKRLYSTEWCATFVAIGVLSLWTVIIYGVYLIPENFPGENPNVVNLNRDFAYASAAILGVGAVSTLIGAIFYIITT